MPGLEPPIIQPVAQRYNNWAIPAPCTFHSLFNYYIRMDLREIGWEGVAQDRYQ
jgi:hypothetical protein